MCILVAAKPLANEKKNCWEFRNHKRKNSYHKPRTKPISENHL